MSDATAEIRERIAALEAHESVATRDRAELISAVAKLSEKLDALDRRIASYEAEARGALRAGAAFKALAWAGWALVLTIGGTLAGYLHKFGALTAPR